MRKFIFTFLLATPAIAAGPYVVDDAATVEPHEIQNENWFYAAESGHVAVTNLAYEPVSNTELLLQATHANDAGDHSDLLSPQIKHRWYQSKTAQAAFVIGADRGVDDPRDSNLFAYVPLTLTPSKRADIHLNLGWLYAREEHEDITLWGVGGAYHATDALDLAAEIFHHAPHEVGYQIGPHWEPGERMDLDLLYGRDVYPASGHLMTLAATFHFPTR